MLLIGAGGGGDFVTLNSGGGSGAVTVWYGAAQNVPNNLRISVGNSQAVSAGGNTTIYYTGGQTPTSIINAQGGQSGGNPGSAMTANQFTNSGFFQSVSGQLGNGGVITASATTFLSGGGYATNGLTGNYGYKTNNNAASGFFQLQPIIVGLGGNSSTTDSVAAGIGCGGAIGNSSGGQGGQGLVLIASW